MNQRTPFALAIFAALQFLGVSQTLATPAPVISSLATYQAGILTDGLGAACFAIDESSGLPCQPAHLSGRPLRAFQAELFLGNNLRLSPEGIEFLRQGKSSPEMIESIFSDRRSSELQSQVDLQWRREHWGIAVTPFRLFYRSAFRNQALTEAQVLAFQEESLRVQVGDTLDSNLAWGFQSRIVHRKFVSQSFFLSDAYTESGAHLLDPQDQSILYLEPGLVYRDSNSVLQPEVGFTMTNLGISNHATAFSQRPQAHLSAGLGTKWKDGSNLRVGIDSFVHEDLFDASESLTLGALYKNPLFSLFGSFSQAASALGVNIPWQKVSFSTVYHQEDINFGGIQADKESKLTFAFQVTL